MADPTRPTDESTSDEATSDEATSDEGYEQEGESHRSTVPLDLDGDGEADEVIAQEPTGAENVAGGGEFPDRDTPPQPPAKGYDAEGDSNAAGG